MKKAFFFLALVTTLASCNSNRYELTERNFLIDKQTGNVWEYRHNRDEYGKSWGLWRNLGNPTEVAPSIGDYFWVEPKQKQ